MKDFITDEEMSQIETESTPDFISDEEMDSISTETQPKDIVQMEDSTRAKLAGAAAYGAVETGKKAISGLTESLLSRAGQLTPEQRNIISLDPEAYRKARPLEELQESFRELGQQTRDTGFSARKEGVASLEGLAPVRGSDIIPELGNISKAPKMKLSPDELPKSKPNISKISRLENLLKQKQELESTLTSMTESGIESFERDTLINEASKKLDKVNSQISKALPDFVGEATSPSIKPTIADFSKVTNLPPELIEARPDLAVSGTKIQKELGKTLQKEIDFLKTGEIAPKDLANYVRKLQEQTSYVIAPTEVDKFKQEIARNVSDYLKELPGAEEYKKGQEISKKAIELEKGFKEFGLSLDSENNIKVTNPKKLENLYKKGSNTEIARFERYVKEAQELGKNMTPTSMGTTPTGIDYFQNELRPATIRQTVETAKDLPGFATAKRFVGSTVGGALGGVPGAIAGYTGASALPTGTKLQELAALAEGSKAFKTATKGAKFLGPVAGLATAGLTYAQGMEEGLNIPESIGVAGAEVLNPIPLTDTLGAYKAAKETYKKESGIEAPIKAVGAGAQAFIKPMTEAQSEIEKKAGMTGQQLLRAERGVPSQAEFKFEDTNGPEMTKFADYLEQTPDKASQEYARVLRRVISSPEREKAATLFSLNQNPAFRELAKKYKGEK